MAKVISRNFGNLEYSPGEQFVFPAGVPGFPDEKQFVPIETPDQFPLIYLQSTGDPNLCFIALPARSLVRDYELSVDSGDLASIGLGPDTQRSEMLCLALLCFGEDGTVTANLRAPLIINVYNRIGMQMIQNDERYPIRFRLESPAQVAVC